MENSITLRQRYFCTLCGREVFDEPTSTGGNYHCSGCEIDHDARYTAGGHVYLARSIPVWRDLHGKSYTALIFPGEFPARVEMT